MPGGRRLGWGEASRPTRAAAEQYGGEYGAAGYGRVPVTAGSSAGSWTGVWGRGRWRQNLAGELRLSSAHQKVAERSAPLSPCTCSDAQREDEGQEGYSAAGRLGGRGVDRGIRVRPEGVDVDAMTERRFAGGGLKVVVGESGGEPKHRSTIKALWRMSTKRR